MSEFPPIDPYDSGPIINLPDEEGKVLCYDCGRMVPQEHMMQQIIPDDPDSPSGITYGWVCKHTLDEVCEQCRPDTDVNLT